jgi:hypothetical protein
MGNWGNNSAVNAHLVTFRCGLITERGDKNNNPCALYTVARTKNTSPMCTIPARATKHTLQTSYSVTTVTPRVTSILSG